MITEAYLHVRQKKMWGPRTYNTYQIHAVRYYTSRHKHHEWYVPTEEIDRMKKQLDVEKSKNKSVLAFVSIFLASCTGRALGSRSINSDRIHIALIGRLTAVDGAKSCRIKMRHSLSIACLRQKTRTSPPALLDRPLQSYRCVHTVFFKSGIKSRRGQDHVR